MNRIFSGYLWLGVLLLTLAPLSAWAQEQEDQSINPPAELMNKPSPVLSPEEALKTFELEEGFEIQLVAAEPLIEDPVCMAWDGDGRLWVCEMRGYMPDQFGNGEDQPTGRIVILQDTDSDGTMDTSEVFLDRIVLPRAIALTKGGVLYADFETLYFVRFNEDGSAGEQVVVDPQYSNDHKAVSNVEHQANGLLYGLDNWYYSAKSSHRYGLREGKIVSEKTELRGQWGITQDDDGRLLANSNPILMEYELLPPHATKRNPNHAKFKPPVVRVEPDVWPIIATPGTNRAYRPGVVDHETWKLKRATAACGPLIYRGTQFPAEYYNNVFVPEPAGNLIKRIVVSTDADGKLTAEHAYQGREFLTSTDERSRMVNAYTGPDGALYLVDMYRGLIQHQTYISDYLRRQINARDLDRPLGYGRIYRVVHKDSPPPNHAAPKLIQKTSEQLVAVLGHPNAWQRHTAQRLLIERADTNSVDPLNVLATTSDNPHARIHALWTLQGMGKLAPGTLALAGQSADTRVRRQVLRLSEDFAGDPGAKPLVALMQQYGQDAPNWAMDMQLALSAGTLAGIDTPEAYDVLLGVLQRRDKVAVDKDHPDYRAQSNEAKLFRSAVISGLRGKEAVMLAKVDGWHIKRDLTAALVKATETGDLSIDSLLALVDSPDFADQRNGLLTTLAAQAVEQGRLSVVDQLVLRLADEATAEDNKHAILKGMVQAGAKRNNPMELDGKPAVFTQLQAQPPEALAEFIAQLDELFLYERTRVSPQVQARIDAGRLLYGAQCMSCHGENGEGIVNSAPPLSPSNWVNASPKMLAALVLNGVEGDIEVNGKLYTAANVQPSMRSFKNAPVSDQDIADILTFIRSKEFGNNAGPVEAKTVADMRLRYASRTQAMSPASLWAIHYADLGEGGPQVVKAAWLNHPVRGLVLTLLVVTASLVVLLVGTIYGAMLPKP